MISLLAALCLLVETPRHDVHLSHSRVVVDHTVAIWRVRMFKDDLAAAMRGVEPRAVVDTAAPPPRAELFLRYFTSRAQLFADGRALTPRVLSSGEEEGMWWYALELPLPRSVKRWEMRNELLFERFDDQKNLVTVLEASSAKRAVLYFVPRDQVRQVIAF